MSVVPDEITIGSLTFTYDVEREELYIAKGENSPNLVEPVWVEDWIEFVNATTGFE